MNSSDFYATAAQVLPTIMIALAIEYGFLLQRDTQEREFDMHKRRELKSAAGWEIVRGVERAFIRVGKYTATWRGVTYTTSGVFLLGEGAAVVALAFRVFNVVTFTIVGVCMVVLIAAVGLVPLARIRSASRL